MGRCAQESIDEIVEAQEAAASNYLLEILSSTQSLKFSQVMDVLLQAFILRETNVKDICVDLEKNGRIERTWGTGNRKPKDTDLIKLVRK
jgi:hypothetical protein